MPSAHILLVDDDTVLRRSLVECEGETSLRGKAERIRAWQEAGKKVAMAGDGVSDAPALPQADLSITAAGGTDVAKDSSDVVLTRHDLTLIPWFIRLPRRIIRENVGWAIATTWCSCPWRRLASSARSLRPRQWPPAACWWSATCCACEGRR